MKVLKLLIGTVFVMTLSFRAEAQEKYEYATVTYIQSINNLSHYDIAISRDGKFEKTSGDVTSGTAGENTLPLLETIDKLSKENWEVYNSNVAISGRAASYIFLLRKKKN